MNKKLLLVVIVAVVVMFLIVGALANGGNNGGTQQQAGDQSSPSGTSNTTGASGGQYNEVGLKVNAVSDPWDSNNPYITADDGKRFVHLDVTMTNNAGKSIDINLFGFGLRTSSGNTYDPSLYSDFGDATKMGAGSEYKTTLLFEIPQGEEPSQLNYDYLAYEGHTAL